MFGFQIHRVKFCRQIQGDPIDILVGEINKSGSNRFNSVQKVTYLKRNVLIYAMVYKSSSVEHDV